MGLGFWSDLYTVRPFWSMESRFFHLVFSRSFVISWNFELAGLDVRTCGRNPQVPRLPEAPVECPDHFGDGLLGVELEWYLISGYILGLARRTLMTQSDRFEVRVLCLLIAGFFLTQCAEVVPSNDSAGPPPGDGSGGPPPTGNPTPEGDPFAGEDLSLGVFPLERAARSSHPDLKEAVVANTVLQDRAADVLQASR
jgi:hypothetical protein